MGNIFGTIGKPKPEVADECNECDKAVKEWARVKSWEHIITCNLNYITFKIPIPNYHMYLNVYTYETSELLNTIYTINQNGIFTIDSQPGTIVHREGKIKSDCTADYYSILRGYIKFGVPKKFENIVLCELNKYDDDIIVIRGICEDIENIHSHGEKRQLMSTTENDIISFCEHRPYPVTGIAVTAKGSRADLIALIKETPSESGKTINISDALEVTLYIRIECDDKLFEFLTRIEQTDILAETQYFTIIDRQWNNGSHAFDVLKEVSTCLGN